ncbi:hypothetical protein FOCC_FOCC010890 [Frankliniella occidentalis]|nr:hypothetical protein FOCC_FOCC010890 [Frankliniella occidentalis]
MLPHKDEDAFAPRRLMAANTSMLLCNQIVILPPYFKASSSFITYSILHKYETSSQNMVTALISRANRKANV